MRLIFPTLALALLLTTTHSQASLGETQTEIMKRYGKPTMPPMAMTNRDLTLYFDYKDYTVGVTLLDGVSSRETYTRKDKKAFRPEELQYLLDASNNGSKWMQVDDNKNAQIWILASKDGMAGYYKSQPYLSIQTPQMLAFDDAIKQAMEKQGKRSAVPVPVSPQKTPDPSLRP